MMNGYLVLLSSVLDSVADVSMSYINLWREDSSVSNFLISPPLRFKTFLSLSKDESLSGVILYISVFMAESSLTNMSVSSEL